LHAANLIEKAIVKPFSYIGAITTHSMYMKSYFTHFLALLVAATFLMIGSANLQAQSEAQSADGDAMSQREIGKGLERPKQVIGRHSHPRKSIAEVAPSLPLSTSKASTQNTIWTQPRIAKILNQQPKHRILRPSKDPLGGLYLGFGLLFFLPSLLTLVLAFALITAPFLLPVLLGLLITFGITGLIGLILIVIGIVVLVTQGNEAKEEKIKSEVIE
jgi:hypothetical protein